MGGAEQGGGVASAVAVGRARRLPGPHPEALRSARAPEQHGAARERNLRPAVTEAPAPPTPGPERGH